MGLDSVELVLAIQDEFGIEIADEDAEKMVTVGQVYDYLRLKLKSTPPLQCLTQRMFYRVRRAFVQNYGLDKKAITLDAKIKDLVPSAELKEAWPYLELLAELDFPRLDKNWWPMGARSSTDVLTLRELLTTMATLNAEKLVFEPGSDEEVWVRLTRVIQKQQNVSLREIQPDAAFGRDLGVD